MAEFNYHGDVAPHMQLVLHGTGQDVEIIGHDTPTIEMTGDTAFEPFLRVEDNRITLTGYPHDLRVTLPREANVELHGIGGDVQVRAVNTVEADTLARLVAHGVGGDVHAAQVAQIDVTAVGGDVEITGASRQVNVGHVGGDLKLDQAAQAHIGAVGGDAELGAIEQLQALGHVGGDLELTWSGNSKGEIRGVVGGDATINLIQAPDLALTALVGGELTGRGDGYDVRGRAGRHELVFGEGRARLHLTVGGDLDIKGGGNMKHSGGQDWGNFRGSFEGMGEEMRGLGRDLEELGRTLARDLSGLGRDIAREVRIAGREAMRNSQSEWRGGRRPRVHVRVNDREFNFDPEQIERIKREARSAAASGIARATEAVEAALRQWEQPGQPPRPPRPPRPPQPPHSYTGQTVRIDRESDDAPATATAEAQPPRDLDAERLAILRMVHEGRLAPDEAEMLLRGLEGQS